MIKCKIIALGSLKESYLKDAVNEYKKRLSRYCSLEICEIEPQRISENPTEAEIENCLKKEAEIILKKIPQNSAVFALCIEGEQISSEKFAENLNKYKNEGKNITFIIGSSHGLAEKIKESATVRLSFSKMTFPHQLFRVMLLEQIYRAFKINEGSAYHK